MANSVNNNLVHPKIVTDVAALITDHKGEDTIVLYIGEQSSYTDYFVITTARSSVHLQSLADRIAGYLKKEGHEILYHTKTRNNSGWFLLDCGNFIVHIMDQKQRSFYELEKLCFPGPEVTYSKSS